MNTTANVANIPVWQNLLLENLQNEVWKPISGFEDSYHVSNFGRVKSLIKNRYNGFGYYKTPDRILKQSIASKTGYLVLNLKRKTHYVHRLVAAEFHLNEDFKTLDVNHKNGTKTDNHFQNLEWLNRSDNCQHAQDTGLAKARNLKNATISEQTAIKILIKHLETGYGKTLLKRHYFPSVSHSCIQGITNNKSWKNLPRNIESLKKILN